MLREANSEFEKRSAAAKSALFAAARSALFAAARSALLAAARSALRRGECASSRLVKGAGAGQVVRSAIGLLK